MDIGYHLRVAINVFLLCTLLQLPIEPVSSAFASGGVTEPTLDPIREGVIFSVDPVSLSLIEGDREERQTGEDILDPYSVFIPLVMRKYASSQNVQITDIFFDGVVSQSESDEYAEVTNHGTEAVNLEGWRLNAGKPSQDFIFPDYLIDPGQSCRVYTDETHPETCGFSFGSGVALWNNENDCGYLYNQSGGLVSSYCY